MLGQTNGSGGNVCESNISNGEIFVREMRRFVRPRGVMGIFLYTVSSYLTREHPELQSSRNLTHDRWNMSLLLLKIDKSVQKFIRQI